jgi:hypothetical protein
MLSGYPLAGESIMSRHLVTSFVRVPLIAAALALRIGSAAAADPTDGVQQMRDLLAGRVATHTAPASTPETTVKQVGDAQQLARELLLGITDSSARAAVPATPSTVQRPEAISAKSLVAHEDAQEMARRLLLGRASTTAGS